MVFQSVLLLNPFSYFSSFSTNLSRYQMLNAHPAIINYCFVSSVLLAEMAFINFIF